MSNALQVIASSNGVTVEEVQEVIRGMIISGKNQQGAVATNAEMTVVSSIFAKYDLNPFVREGHAFISGNKLQVMIGLDGWLKIMNRQPDYDGYEQIDNFDGNGELVSVTTKIYVKGRKYPTPHTEYMDEAYQQTSPAWRKYKKRMLSGKSLGQCVRKSFGISEVLDVDEAARIDSSVQQGEERDITTQAPEINWAELDAQMAECITQEQLQTFSSGIKADMQRDGTWSKYKGDIVAMNASHRARIDSMGTEIEGELVDGEQAE
jgi:hypothetical protein